MKTRIKKESHLSPEAQSILTWCSKRKVTCNWVLYENGKSRTLCMNRGPVFIYSESMTNEEVIALTYEEMKTLLISLYRQLKEREV